MAQFTKLANGWKFRFSYYTPDGKRHFINKQGFKTKREAEVAARQFENERDKGFTPQLSKKTLAIYFSQWYSLYIEPTARYNTRHRYATTINTLKKADIGNYALSRITPQMYQIFINDYGKTRAKWTVKKLNAEVRASVKRAIFDGLLYRDFTQNVNLVYDESKSRVAVWLNAEQTQTVISDLVSSLGTSRRPISRYMILVDLLTGLRMGELMALTWKDINFDKAELTVNKRWDYVNDKFAPTKTKSSVRTIAINSLVIDQLKNLKAFQDGRNETTDKSKIFLNRNHQINSVAALNKQVRNVLAECDINIPEFHFHSLRHTHASYLLYKQVSIFSISQRLGHSNVQITMSVYSHVMDEMQKAERSKTLSALDNLG